MYFCTIKRKRQWYLSILINNISIKTQRSKLYLKRDMAFVSPFVLRIIAACGYISDDF